MAFFQDPPRLTNTYEDDPLLRELLARTFSPAELAAIEPELSHLGALAAGPLLAQQQAERTVEPTLVQWDAWGRRVDRIEVTPLWREAAVLAARHGLVATAYERRHGARSRIHQLALVYLLEPSTDVYACPLAMTDGAARTILDSGNAPLIERAVPRLTSRDPARAWTSGQWMTERTGGSDVSGTETIARRGADGVWRLHGTKWFSSATTAEMALALARPEGNPAGSRGLALFHVELRRDDGTANGVLVNRLKDKLGTRKLPTAELTLDGAIATPVAGLEHGVRAVAPMLAVTRTWNAVVAAAGMQRALALARDYARRRAASGTPLDARPLHRATLAALEAEREGAFLLAFHAGALLGAREAGEGDAARALLRVVTPLAKLATGKQAVAVASEALECFGGAGYVEDTGLPRLLRDAQVLPIWEGTTNVLALEALRALAAAGGADALAAELRGLAAQATDPALRPPVEVALRAADHARSFLATAPGPAREAGARGVALTLARALEVLLLAAHAQWCLSAGRGGRAVAAARTLARHGVDVVDEEAGDTDALLSR